MNRLLDINVLPNRKLSPVLSEAAGQCITSLLDGSAPISLIGEVKKAISLAFDNVLNHGSSAHEYEVKLCISNDGDKLIFELKDTGLPGDLFETDEGIQIKSLGCNYENINLFHQGRCQKMIFTLPVSIDEIPAENADDITPITDARISIRETNDDDFDEIGRAFYRDMGLTYLCNVYDPAFLRDFLKKDNVHGLSAVTKDGTFAGFHCITGWDILPDVYEGGMAVTNPRVRKCGAFSRLMEANNAYFDDVIKRGVQVSAANTLHDITQKTRLKYGFTPCGYNFNALSSDDYQTGFRQKTGYLSGGLSCHVIDHSPKTVYVPKEIIHVLDVVYSGEKLPRTYVTESSVPDTEMTVHADHISPDAHQAVAVFQKIGKDYKEVLGNYVRLAKSQLHDMLLLYVSTDHPGVTDFYEEAKQLGFFFEGIIPCTGYGDMLLMINLFNNLIDYESMVTIGPYTDMLEMIRKFDPNTDK